MFIFTYTVYNDAEYDRHEFDGCLGDAGYEKEAAKKLLKLKKQTDSSWGSSQVEVYDMTATYDEARELGVGTAAEFCEDINDEEVNGVWAIALESITADEYKEIMAELK